MKFYFLSKDGKSLTKDYFVSSLLRPPVFFECLETANAEAVKASIILKESVCVEVACVPYDCKCNRCYPEKDYELIDMGYQR